MERNGLLTCRAAAREVGVCAETIRRWIRSGTLPAVRPSGYRYLIRPDDLDRVFEAVSEVVVCSDQCEYPSPDAVVIAAAQ